MCACHGVIHMCVVCVCRCVFVYVMVCLCTFLHVCTPLCAGYWMEVRMNSTLGTRHVVVTVECRGGDGEVGD